MLVPHLQWQWTQCLPPYQWQHRLMMSSMEMLKVYLVRVCISYRLIIRPWRIMLKFLPIFLFLCSSVIVIVLFVFVSPLSLIILL